MSNCYLPLLTIVYYARRLAAALLTNNRHLRHKKQLAGFTRQNSYNSCTPGDYNP